MISPQGCGTLVVAAPAAEQAGFSLTQAAEAAARSAEEEARRRRHLAGEYAASLDHQLELLHQDLHARQDQWASFCSALMEAQRLLKGTYRLWARDDLPGWAEPRRVCTWLIWVRLVRYELREGRHGFMESPNWPCQSVIFPSLIVPIPI